ncbi:hypothetical protein KEM54_004909 [Ascosphaera aggregata]|nr:hypothetical protein KEM54_004909 [Ascosphaera aggregata]
MSLPPSPSPLPLPSLSPSPFRHFSSSALRSVTQKPSKSPQSLRPLSPLKPPTSSTSATAYSISPSQLLSQALRDAGGSIVLYEGPSHRSQRMISYIAGISSGIMIVYTLSIGLDNNASVPYLTRAMMSAVSIAWMLMTWLCFSGIRGQVSRITAYTTVVPKTKQMETELEIRVRSVIPFFKERIYRVAPKQVRIMGNIIPTKPRTALEQEAYDTMVKCLQEEEKLRKTSFFKAPLTKTSFICHTILRNTRYAFTKELMVKMYITEDKADAKTSSLTFDSTGKFAPAYRYLEPLIADPN